MELTQGEKNFLMALLINIITFMVVMNFTSASAEILQIVCLTLTLIGFIVILNKAVRMFIKTYKWNRKDK
jgi:hypothetical protein|nr:MAG TPA: hypothetical protein [Caudoviricetes sp.]